MAIFCRRTLQRLINENAAVLTRKQLASHVEKLNDGDLSAEWEVVLLNVFSKIGRVSHERDFNGKNPDLHFVSNDHAIEFLADIKTVSDEGIDVQNPQRELNDRLHDSVAKYGVRGHWDCTVGGDFEGAKRTGSMVRLKLPALSRFDRDIFNSNWESFVHEIKVRPHEKRTYAIRNNAVDVSITYTPSENWTGSGGHPSYKSMTRREHLIQNSVWNGLVAKAAQLEATEYSGTLGIILCDGGSEFLRRSRQIIHEFFRVHPAIKFVLAFDVQQNFGGNASQVLTYFEHSEQLTETVREFLSHLHKTVFDIFPYPQRNAINARNVMRSKKKHLGVSHYGGMTMRGTEVRVSSRTVLDLLAGKITYEDFPDSYKEFFADMAGEGRLLTSACVEKDSHEQDDDWLLFTFGKPDPAVRPFTVRQK
jgi:hypothetical protein